MTINSETRVAGPFDGNDSTVSFPFTFKVFDSDEVRVVAETGAVETDLALGTDYTVTLNADQNAAPGGSVVLVSPLATGTRLTLTSALEMLQPVDLTNQGGFYPRVINSALDRLTILLQQLASVVSRTLKFPLSDGPVGDLPGRSVRAGTVLAFDEATGEPVAGPDISSVNGVAGALVAVNTVAGNIADVNTVATNIADVSNFSGVYYGASSSDPTTRRDGSPLQSGDLYFNPVTDAMRTFNGTAWRESVSGAVTVQNFSGDGVKTEFLLDYAPESEVITNVFIGGVYQQKNTYELGGANGDVLIFSGAPPVGTDNIEVVVSSLIPSDDKLRQELASADGVKLIGGALRKMADVAALRAEQGARDGEQVWLEAYGAGFANGGGGGPMFWDAASVAADDGWRVFAVAGVTTGRWIRQVAGEIDAAWFGLPKAGYCYDEIVKIEAHCFANKVGCYFGPGVYDVGAQNWPFRNPEVPATSLRDYTGVVIRTAGPSTVFKTTSDTGADVLQCNGIKGLRVVGYPTVTATLNGTTGAGSNGLSITYGGQDLYFELNCVDLPFVDKGTYGDGGKAFSIQPGGSNTNPIRNIVIKGLARNCLYATGFDVTYDSLSTNPVTGVVFDVVAEDCFRAFSGGVSAPTVTPVDPAMLGVSGRIKAINCQQVIVASRTPGMSLDIEVLNTKAKVDLGGYLASFPVVQVADVKAIKNSSFKLHGRVRDIDTLLSTGGTSMGGGISGDCAAMQLVLDVSFSSATTQVEVISSGGNRVSSSDISLYGVTVGFDDLLLYGGNSLKVDGKAKSPTAYPGDASVASAPAPFFAAIYAAELTAVRTVSLNASAKSGDRVRVARLAASTGSTLSVGGLRNITAGQWIECTYNGSAWEITSSGSI